MTVTRYTPSGTWVTTWYATDSVLPDHYRRELPLPDMLQAVRQDYAPLYRHMIRDSGLDA